MQITTRDGRELRHHTVAVRGTADNPMSRTEAAEKSLDLAAPVLGRRRAQALVDAVLNIDKLADVRQLRVLLRA